MADIFENAHALLIGVGNDLPFTVDDAQALKDVIVDPAKAAYDPANVNLVANETASKKGIVDGFNRLITDTDENSTVIVYYSGHGAHTKSGKTFFLVPHNYDPNDHNTWFKADEFSEKLSQIKAKKLVVMLDACHAQGMSKSVDNIGQDSDREGVSKNVRSLANELSKGTGRAVLSSCTDNELSWKLPGNKNSLFTTTILEALQGKHLREPDERFVDMLQIIRYVFKEVPERSRTVGENQDKKQHPFLNSMTNLSADGFPICYLPEGIRKGILPPAPKARPLLEEEKAGLERNMSLLIRKIEFMEGREIMLADPAQIFLIQEQISELKDKRASFKRRIDRILEQMG